MSIRFGGSLLQTLSHESFMYQKVRKKDKALQQVSICILNVKVIYYGSYFGTFAVCTPITDLGG